LNKEAHKSRFGKVIEQFDAYFRPKRNVIHERAQFHMRNQQQGESVEEYVRTLYDLADNCDFKNDRDETIRDRLVLGLLDKEVSQKLQLETELTVKTAIETARHHELVKKQIHSQKLATGAQDVSGINAARGYPPHRSVRGGRGKLQARGQQHTQINCTRCGRAHGAKCPAEGKICKKCHKRNHFAVVCRSRRVDCVEAEEENFSYKHEENQDDYYQENYGMSAVNNKVVSEVQEPPWKAIVQVESKPISFKIDTGADVCVISRSEYESFVPKPALQKSEAQLRSPGGMLQCMGEFSATFAYKENATDLRDQNSHRKPAG
jgi:hypothetical protein